MALPVAAEIDAGLVREGQLRDATDLLAVGHPAASCQDRNKGENGAPDGVTIATWLLVIVGAFQVALFWRQLDFMRSGVEDATTAANAAKQSAEAAEIQARAMVAAESPRIAMISMDLKGMTDDANRKFGIIDATAYLPSQVKPIITFYNTGRTAADIVEWSLTHRILKGDPPEIPVHDEIFTTNLIIEQAKPLPIEWGRFIVLTEDTAAKIAQAKLTFWIYGFIVYKDFLGGLYEFGFIGNWNHNRRAHTNPGGFVLEGPPAYNYLRKRK
jgi:hypothetical protein